MAAAAAAAAVVVVLAAVEAASQELTSGGKAPAWLHTERISHSVAGTWHACSGTTPEEDRHSFGSEVLCIIQHNKFQVGVEAPSCDPSTWKVEVGESL